MILSVSRRTDIPAWYADWFFARLHAGYADVRNPYRPGQVSRVPMTPDVVDGIVFWTKNPLPMLDRLGELGDMTYYFQFTLTPYGSELEPGLPSKAEVLIPALRRLSGLAGTNRVVWRYDPVVLTREWTVDRHRFCFQSMAQALEGATDECIVSFVDDYACNRRRMRQAGGYAPDESRARELLRCFGETAQQHGMKLSVCCEAALAEGMDSAQGVGPAHCIDAGRLSAIAGRPVYIPCDPHQREGCGCAKSVDIGAYDTCRCGCVYCYALHSAGRTTQRVGRYSVDSSLLCDHLQASDQVTAYGAGQREGQMSLFGPPTDPEIP